MHYAIGDIHNDSLRFEQMLKIIDLKSEDHLYLMGDLFDRCNSNPDPVGVYFDVLKLADRVSVVMGNHDIWLAEYIESYYSVSERKRKRITPYGYNSFELMNSRLTEVDMLQLATYIKSFPLQIEVEVEGIKYLMGHAMTADPSEDRHMSYYIMGIDAPDFFESGILGYISICGHTDTSFMKVYKGKYSDDTQPSIWRNDAKNLYMIDCGCGFSSGRLACVCLETGEEFYV